MYKTHTMATCHRGSGHPLDRDINLHVEESKTTGLDNDNESTSGSDTTVALGGSEIEGYHSDIIHSNQAKLTALMREINDLCQWVEAREGTDSREFGLHKTRTTKSLTSASATSFSNTYCTFQRSDMSVHRHVVYHAKANKPN